MDKDRVAQERPRVHVVDSPDTTNVASDIIRGLDRLGVDASAPAPTERGQTRAVIVLLSARALEDPEWLRGIEALRGERLVPVSLGDLVDEDVPGFLRELNWVFYLSNDQGFLARLFTGINTDASRFRNARDTRALAERWEAAGRDPDFLLDNIGEVKRRISTAQASAEGSDPLIPKERPLQRARDFATVRGMFLEAFVDGEDPLPLWQSRVVSTWFALRAVSEGGVFDEATPLVAFLAASRRHARRMLRQRLWRATYRTAIAGAAVVAISFAVVVVQQAVKKSTNATAFTIGDQEHGGRADLAALKAGASLVDSGARSDARLRIAADALSQHWPVGYLPTGDWGTVSVNFLADGSITALDYAGSMWTWSASLDSRAETSFGLAEARGGDVSSGGDLVVISDGAQITVIEQGVSTQTIRSLDSIQLLRIAPAHNRLLVLSGAALYALSIGGSESPSPTKLGTWDTVLDIVQTEDGHAVALAEQDGELQLVHDDGSITSAGAAPRAITRGALSTDGTSFALVVDGIIWTSTGGDAVSSGIVVPGVVTALSVTSDGLVLVADRTRGSWVADPRLGINLGQVCAGFGATTDFAVETGGDRVLCLQGPLTSIDSLADLRPASIGGATPAPVQKVASHGQVKSLSLVDGLIRLDRADGASFAFDAASLSFAPGFERPAGIDGVNFFATGARIKADGLPTSVAVTPDGNTFAIGFIDGRLIEVDLDASGYIAPVGSWQLPDHLAVMAISWSVDARTISATTAAGTTWNRLSCAGCWGAWTLTEHIAERAWLCYANDDIESLGDTVRREFRLRDCESQWDGKE